MAAILAVVLVLVVLFGSAAVWVFYAYTHPTSPSGMWLMEVISTTIIMDVYRTLSEESPGRLQDKLNTQMHAHTHVSMHARTHACTHGRTHTHTHKGKVQSTTKVTLGQQMKRSRTGYTTWVDRNGKS